LKYSDRLKTLLYAGIVILGELIILLGFFGWVGESQSASNNYCGTPKAYNGCAELLQSSFFVYAVLAVGVAMMILGFVLFFRRGR